MTPTEIKPCPYCGEAWLYVSNGDYYSDYESNGYRMECKCGFARDAVLWNATKEKAIKEWNEAVYGVESEISSGNKLTPLEIRAEVNKMEDKDLANEIITYIELLEDIISESCED